MNVWYTWLVQGFPPRACLNLLQPGWSGWNVTRRLVVVRAILALAFAPWPARRVLNVEKIQSVSRDAPPSPQCQESDVKPALRQSDPRKKHVQSIPYIYPIYEK